MKLIVNADDFGLNKEVNEGIIEGHREGIITSTSILSNFNLNRLPEEKTLGYGIHLNVTMGRSLVTGEKFPSKMWTRAYLIKTKVEFIEKEFRKQIQNLLDLGYKLDHINTHQHIHTISPVTEIVYKLAREYKIKYVRYPKERMKEIKLNNIISYSIAHLNMKKFPPYLKCAKNFFGFLDTGNPKLEHYIKYLDFDESAEIVCHPSKRFEGHIDKLSSTRYKEFLVLTDNRLKEEIKNRGIKLIRCKDLW